MLSYSPQLVVCQWTNDVDSEVRGALVATQQLAITFGIMISFWID